MSICSTKIYLSRLLWEHCNDARIKLFDHYAFRLSFLLTLFWLTEEFPKEFTLSVKEHAEIYTSFAVFKAVNTEWNDYPQLRNLKKSLDLTPFVML